MARKYEDLIGRKFWRLTVVSLIEVPSEPKRYRRHWVCLCECGNTIIVRRPDALKSGYIKSCGCYSLETIRLATLKTTLPEGKAAFNSLFSQYRGAARKRKIPFPINKEEFKTITKKDCFYCGSAPENEYKPAKSNGGYIFNGVDRIDSNKGYSLDNCVPCCKTCNYMKIDMSLKEFLECVDNVYKYTVQGIIPKYVEVEAHNSGHALNIIKLSYKHNARVKNNKFNLSDAEFVKFLKSNCVYCGRPPCNVKISPNGKWKYTFNGVDRKDNTEGYNIGNCVPCCKQCNYMKGTLSVDFFIAQIIAIKQNVVI